MLRIGASHGAICVGTFEALWQVGPNVNHHIDYGRELRERRLWYEHARHSFMTRVSRCQHDRFFLRWEEDCGITGLSSSTTCRGELVSIREGHPDLPFGFSDSLMVWGTSPMWQGDRHEEIRGGTGRREFNFTRIGLHL